MKTYVLYYTISILCSAVLLCVTLYCMCYILLAGRLLQDTQNGICKTSTCKDATRCASFLWSPQVSKPTAIPTALDDHLDPGIWIRKLGLWEIGILLQPQRLERRGLFSIEAPSTSRDIHLISGPGPQLLDSHATWIYCALTMIPIMASLLMGISSRAIPSVSSTSPLLGGPV